MSWTDLNFFYGDTQKLIPEKFDTGQIFFSDLDARNGLNFENMPDFPLICQNVLFLAQFFIKMLQI